MLKLRHLLAIFIPAILIIVAVFFVRIIQYQPLYPKQSAGSQKNITDFTIPIFSTDPVLGDRQAPATLIVFSDLGCALCREEFSIWQKILKTYPKKFKIIWKALPVTQIPYDTRLANSYAYCANEQKNL